MIVPAVFGLAMNSYRLYFSKARVNDIILSKMEGKYESNF